MASFRAYRITAPNGRRSYDTVRGRAAATARELGGTSEEIEIPSGKADLIPFLNALERRFEAPPATEPALPAIQQPEPVPARPSAIAGPSRIPAAGNLTALEAWILDEASQREIERLFSALGARFGEIVRANRTDL